MEAIDALKQKILSLAIQGKLVPQDPNDEPASVLLEKIKAEKAELVKQGKIKKDKQESRIYKGDDNKYYEQIGTETKDITDEIPFEIPNNWEFMRLKNISDAYTGNSISENIKASKYTNLKEGYNYIGTKDVGFNHVITYENGVKIPFNETSFRYAYKNAILLCIEGGSAGRKVGILSEQVCFGNKLCAFHTFGIPEDFLYYLIQSDYFFDLFKENVSGLIGGVSINKIKELIIPLPPLSEQKRIVAAIEKIFNQIEVVKENQDELSKLKDGLKNKILDLAIQEKLVEQDPNDEPASELLKKIKAEKAELVKQGKIKKDKQESYIFKGDDNRHYEQIGSETKDITDEIPFDIPNNWAWFRLENVCQLITKGSSPKWQGIKYVTNDGVLFITSENVGVKNIILKEKKYVEKKFNEIEPRSILKYNDILMNIVGASIGRTALYSINEIANINQAVCLIRLLDSIKNQFFIEYLLYFLNSSICLKYMEDKKVDCARANLSMGNISNFLIPLPPIKEQERITTKLNDIINIIKVL